DAGARFVVSPTLTPAVIRVCRDRDIPCMPGAFTPTEIVEAWRAGAPLVKLFPAAAVGPDYVRDLLAPLPFLRLVPSGGVSLENAGDWIRAGAAAESVGSALLRAALVRDEAAGGGGRGGGRRRAAGGGVGRDGGRGGRGRRRAVGALFRGAGRGSARHARGVGPRGLGVRATRPAQHRLARGARRGRLVPRLGDHSCPG